MTVLTVLENETELIYTRDLIAEIMPDADLMCFENSLPALAAARSREIDIAILDTKLTELSGIDFGQYLQDLYPLINLIYLSEDKELGYAAMNQHASGFLLKPASRDNLQRELEDLRHPVPHSGKTTEIPKRRLPTCLICVRICRTPLQSSN